MSSLQPSPKYAHDLLVASLALPVVNGMTVYTTEVPRGPCPNEQDKGCIVRELFGKAGASGASPMKGDDNG